MKFVFIIIHKGIGAHAPNESLLTNCIALTTLPNFMQHKTSNAVTRVFTARQANVCSLYLAIFGGKFHILTKGK